jgi:hypothetical protein
VKECIAREPMLERYLALVRRMETYFKEFIEDDLAKATTCNTPMPADVFFHVLEDASVKTILPEHIIINIVQGEDWRALIMA